ncbi:Calcium-transporting ATPase 12, plasma membrane-type [Camellia lanceoleosa]|uniref:Calcium-transporting ATPase 12, plasma membrane-type n=1 Tax=Camellia lanceoleosa TaxID=1840588 RepID=A0ACC0HGF4_9ERIC|nr:Calcium-transporting ATPase 12, plasma membrane-type [Camellia lanceoleosa]
MKVTKFWLGQESMEERNSTSISDNVLGLLHQGVGLNTTGTVYKSASGSKFEFSGGQLKKQFFWVMELNMDMEKLKQSCSILHVEAFNSTKKRSGVSMRKKDDNTINVHWKGAAEMVLAMCSHYYDVSGEIKVLDDVERKKFDQMIQGMAVSSLRCIAFAHKQVQDEENEGEKVNKNLKDSNLTLLGLVGIKDPCRSGVQIAVKACQYAGVNIKMIPVDNVFTARAIATECGILRPNQDLNGAVVEGEEFRNYTPEERLEKKGHVVAVTGDGTNDAPALNEADIGLSMGIQGTEVAKESSDIVILDDNFGSVVTVLKWGSEVPLTDVQLLWVNLIMDTLGALALTTEKPSKELMQKPPVGRTKPLITNIMWRNLLAQAFYQIAVLLTLQFGGKSIFGVNTNVNNMLIFNTFVLCQVFNEFNARKLEKKNVFKEIHRSKLFLAIIGITIVLQVVMVEFLKKFASTERG